MRSFQRPQTLGLVPGDVVILLARIDRALGTQTHAGDRQPKMLAALFASARIESITASNAIEGVVVSRARSAALLAGYDGQYRNRSEAEFAGYSRAQDYLLHGDPGLLSVGLILHLHRLLYSYSDGGGGRFKIDDNVVVQTRANGDRQIRFTPTSASDTPYFVSELVERTNSHLNDRTVHPLVVIAASVLDLSCIHPFADGNGRVGRLVTSHLLSEAGYTVGQYVSLEQLIFETKADYYASLSASTQGWFDDGRHSVWPWIRYFLARLDQAYSRFALLESGRATWGTKQDRVHEFVRAQVDAKFKMSDIRRALPGVSDPTIRLVLAELKAQGRIEHDGAGRSASWRLTQIR